MVLVELTRKVDGLDVSVLLDEVVEALTPGADKEDMKALAT